MATKKAAKRTRPHSQKAHYKHRLPFVATDKDGEIISFWALKNGIEYSKVNAPRLGYSLALAYGRRRAMGELIQLPGTERLGPHEGHGLRTPLQVSNTEIRSVVTAIKQILSPYETTFAVEIGTAATMALYMPSFRYPRAAKH